MVASFSTSTRFSLSSIVFSWLVHFFTASGAVLGLLALRSASLGDTRSSLVLLGISIVIDAVDGFFARRGNVKETLPHFDGALLDNIVDYLTYVIVPAYIVLIGDFLPQPLATIAATSMVLSSAYSFSQVNAKTPDHFFLGFPSYWSIVVFYLFIFNPSSFVNECIIFSCAFLSFIPIKFIYPSRMPNIFGSTVLTSAFKVMLLLWGAASLVLLWPVVSLSPRIFRWFSIYSAFFSALYVFVSIAITFNDFLRARRTESVVIA